MRLNLDIEDYIRAAIMARKTTSRALGKPGSRHIKMKYYELMLRYYSHFDNYHFLAKCWMEIYDTAQDEVCTFLLRSILHFQLLLCGKCLLHPAPYCTTPLHYANDTRHLTSHAFSPTHTTLPLQETKKEIPDHPIVKDPSVALASVLVYVALSPATSSVDKEQTDAAALSTWNKETCRTKLLEKYLAEKAAVAVPEVVGMASSFLEKELVHWPAFSATYKAVSAHQAFAEKETRWGHLHKRVTEHNLKVIAKHYTAIRMTRLSKLIDLSPEETEEALCKLVTDKEVWARIDRIQGVASFAKQKNPNEVMTDFKSGIDHVLAQLTSACHLISKETLLHQFKQS